MMKPIYLLSTVYPPVDSTGATVTVLAVNAICEFALFSLSRPFTSCTLSHRTTFPMEHIYCVYSGDAGLAFFGITRNVYDFVFCFC